MIANDLLRNAAQSCSKDVVSIGTGDLEDGLCDEASENQVTFTGCEGGEDCFTSLVAIIGSVLLIGLSLQALCCFILLF